MCHSFNCGPIPESRGPDLYCNCVPAEVRLRILWSDGNETFQTQDEYEGLESLEQVPITSLVACDGLLAEWSQFYITLS